MLDQSTRVHAGVPRARRSNVQFDVEESPIIGEGSLKSTSWARKPTSNRSTFDVERSPDLKPSDHAGVVMEADVQYKEEQVGCGGLHVFLPWLGYVHWGLEYAVRLPIGFSQGGGGVMAGGSCIRLTPGGCLLSSC